MIINLLPQISKKTAERIIKEFAEKGQIEESDISKIQNEEIKNIYWTPVGQGSRKILADKLFILREQIIQLAENYGFRNSMPNKFLEFEYKLAILFTDQNYCDFLWNDGYPTGETLRNSFWSYLTIILLPDIATWRWEIPQSGEPNKAWTDRMLGGTRNTFQRVFKRVISFDKGIDHFDRLDLIKDLMEDDFSAILERTSLGGNPKIAKCLAEEFLNMRKRCFNLSKKIQTEIYRKATKDLTAYGKVQSLDVLDKSDLRNLIYEVFSKRENDINI